MDTVHILRGDREAKLVFDPMRREILRLLAKKTFTAANLSATLGLSAPTIGHHLSALRRGGLVEIVKTEAGDHGIVQKFYRSTAQVYVLDLRQMSPPLRRYFMPNRIERTRGILAALSLEDGGTDKPSTELVEKMTEDLVPYMVAAAERRRGPSNGGDVESLLYDIYREALGNYLKDKPGTLHRISVTL